MKKIRQMFVLSVHVREDTDGGKAEIWRFHGST